MLIRKGSRGHIEGQPLIAFLLDVKHLNEGDGWEEGEREREELKWANKI